MAISEPKPSDFQTEADYARAYAAWGNLREADRLAGITKQLQGEGNGGGFGGGGASGTWSDDNPIEGTTDTSAQSVESQNIPTVNVTGQKTGTAFIDERFPGVRKTNPLSNYSSYAYSISLYMVTPEYMNKFTFNDPPATLPTDSDGIWVIAQSGGINNSFDKRLLTKSRKLQTGNSKDSSPEEGLDYYIEDVSIENVISPSPTNLTTVFGSVEFKIIEPIGFSFLQDLAIASTRVNGLSSIAKSAPSTKAISFQQGYILGIRFYGYDVNGKVVNPGQEPTIGNISNVKTDENSVAERFVSLAIENITFKLDDKATVYSVKAKNASAVAYSQKINTINGTTNVRGLTVDDALAGPNGLITVLNNKTEQSIKNMTAEERKTKLPNRYKIEWVGGDDNPIAQSQLVDDATVEKALTAMYDVPSTDKSNVSGSLRSRTYDPTTRILSFQAGTTITAMIDNIIVKSDYITKALNQVNSGEVETTSTINANLKELQWYYINAVTKILGRDDALNDWAYETTYQIGVYKVPYIRSQFVNNRAKYPGPFKVYNYIYTGENSEVIEFEQTYNQLYGVIQPLANRTTENVSVNLNKKIGSVPLIAAPSVNSDSTSGKQNAGSFLNENVRAQLYSEDDQTKATLKILGDPDWIMSIIGVDQKIPRLYGNDSSNGLSGNSSTNGKAFARQLYGPDYSINPYGGQAFIQIIFNIATDYQDNGLLDVGDDIMFYESQEPAKNGIQGVVYQVDRVYSSFSKGSFTQTFGMALAPRNLLSVPSDTSTSNDRETPAQDTGRKSVDLSTGGFIDADRQASTYSAGDFSGDFIGADQSQAEQISENQEFADDDREPTGISKGDNYKGEGTRDNPSFVGGEYIWRDSNGSLNRSLTRPGTDNRTPSMIYQSERNAKASAALRAEAEISEALLKSDRRATGNKF